MKRALLILGFALFLVPEPAVSQSNGCCVTSLQTCIQNYSSLFCDQQNGGSAGSNFHSGVNCDQVPFCATPGKCVKGDECTNTKRWQCDQKIGYQFFANQSCGSGDIAAGHCCAEPKSARNPACKEDISREQCQRLGWEYRETLCYAISHCPQAATGPGTVEKQKGRCELKSGICHDNWTAEECSQKGGTFGEGLYCTLKFTPSVPIPGLLEGTQEVTGTLLARYIGAFYIYFIGVVSILAIVMMMWGGYHYIVSAGNPQQMTRGKEIISGALIGLVLAITSFLLLKLVNPALVTFSGIVPSYVERVLQPRERSSIPQKYKGVLGIDLTEAGLRQILSKVKENNYHQMIYEEVKKQINESPTVSYRLLALLFIESGGNKEALSPAGACGLLQLLPSTAKKDCNALFDPKTNIAAAVTFYKSLLQEPCPQREEFKKCESENPCKKDKENIIFANAAYNGGRGANYCSVTCKGETWWQCQNNPGYQETRNYVVKAQQVFDWLREQRVY